MLTRNFADSALVSTTPALIVRTLIIPHPDKLRAEDTSRKRLRNGAPFAHNLRRRIMLRAGACNLPPFQSPFLPPAGTRQYPPYTEEYALRGSGPRRALPPGYRWRGDRPRQGARRAAGVEFGDVVDGACPWPQTTR